MSGEKPKPGRNPTSEQTDRRTAFVWFAILALAVTYYVTARLSLQLAIEPGYATAIWPASGIALAALLLFGRRLWPGVLLGSFFANTLAITTPDTGDYLVAASIGIGASLQALLAAHWLKPILERDPSMLNTSSIVSLVGVGGALSCLVSTTWGSTTLLLAGVTSASGYLQTWGTWWVGDVIGVVVVVPLAFIALAKPRLHWRRRIGSVAIPLLVTLVLVGGVFFAASEQSKRRQHLEFDQQAVAVGDALTTKVATHLEALQSIQSLYAASETVTRTEFRQFVDRAMQRLPGIHALSWNPRISDEQRLEFEQAARRDGLVDFQIKEFRGKQMVPAQRRAHYVAVSYIEPLAGNESVLGLDVYSNPTRRAAIDQARETGQPVATSAISLVQETGNQLGTLVFVPVFEDGVVPDTIVERDRHLLGYAVGVFRIGDVIQSAIHQIHVGNLDVRLIDTLSDNSVGEVLAAFRIDADGASIDLTGDPDEFDSTFEWSKRYPTAGRQWRLVVNPGPDYFSTQTHWQAWALLAGSLSLVALLGTFLLSLTGRQMLDEQRSAEMATANRRLNDEMEYREQVERTLESERDRVKITLHSIADAVVTTDNHGNVEYLNPAAERFAGWRLDEALGKSVSSVLRIITESTREPIDPVAGCLDSKAAVKFFDQSLLINHHGEEFAIQETAAPIFDRDERLVGAVLVFNDVTESRRQVREVAHQASHDELTGLVNRREFEKRLARSLASAKQYGSQHALCYIDLDYFKRVNDAAGHLAGDELLRRLADLFEAKVRERDTVARLGGDEFGVLLDNCPISKAVEIAADIVAQVDELEFDWQGKTYQVGASIGVTPVTSEAESVEQLAAEADGACYTAKDHGRGRVHLYTPQQAHDRVMSNEIPLRRAADS